MTDVFLNIEIIQRGKMTWFKLRGCVALAVLQAQLEQVPCVLLFSETTSEKKVIHIAPLANRMAQMSNIRRVLKESVQNEKETAQSAKRARLFTGLGAAIVSPSISAFRFWRSNDKK